MSKIWLAFIVAITFTADVRSADAVPRDDDRSTVKSSFRLFAGKYEFQVECDGCKTFVSELEVVGYGSEQWLIATLRTGSNKVDNPEKLDNEN